MRAGLRITAALVAAGILAGAAPALAQETSPTAAPASNAPATDAIGPKALQNFSLEGQVTRPADPPAVRTPAAPKRHSAAEVQPSPGPAQPTAAPATKTASRAPPASPEPRKVETAVAPPRAERARQSLAEPAPAGSVTVALPSLTSSPSHASPAAAAAAATGFAPDPEPAQTLAPVHGMTILPWLLLALVLGAGGGFFFWRSRPREALAGGGRLDSFTATEPGPQAAAAPPKAVPPPPIPGLVSTRLRPRIEVGFHPLRCILDEQRAAIEFEIEMFNSGSAPAQAVLIEASLFNAGPTQDRDIGNFFTNPVAQGERIAVIPPLKRVALRTQVAIDREQIHAYEIGGRQVFVPIIAFNALYRWSRGEGQTSVSYLLGRDTKGEKMAPFRLDLGPRLFRALGARLLPLEVRT